MAVNNAQRNERGVSPVIGVGIILGISIVIILGLFIIGGDVFTGDEDPREDANFELNIEDEETVKLIYDTGDDFTPSDTEAIYLTGQAKNGTEWTMEDNITVYYNGQTTGIDDSQSQIETNDVVFSADNMEKYLFNSSAIIRVVWVPEDDPDRQLVIDELSSPTEAEMVADFAGAGDPSGEMEITIDGCDPQEEDCE